MSATTEIFEAIAAGDSARVGEIVRDDPSAAAARDDTGVSVLLYAHYRGQAGSVAALRSARADLDVFEAAALGDTDRLRELLAGEPGLVDAWSPDGFTPLHLSAFFGREEEAALLLERSADVNALARNPMRVVPLHSAIAGGHSALARALVEAGADVNARQQEAFTPLHEAAQNGDGDLVTYLLEHGADPAAELSDGRTPAELARDHGHAGLAGRLS